ncbi:MAG: HEAT repeat domain-containing protein [Pirellulales bacterium]
MPTSRMRALALVWCWLFAIGCDSASDRLIAQLQDGDPKTRRAAARALGERSDGAEPVVAALGSACHDPDAGVRECAAVALGSLKAASVASLPVLDTLLDDPESSVRIAAALAIQKIDPRHESYVAVLTDALKAGHGPVFLEVGQMGAGAEWAVPMLVTKLSDPRASIRALAARTLGKIGVADSKTKSALKRSLRDDRPAVRKAAQHALEQIQGKNRG